MWVYPVVLQPHLQVRQSGGAKHVGTMEPREHTCVLPINLSKPAHMNNTWKGTQKTYDKVYEEVQKKVHEKSRLNRDSCATTRHVTSDATHHPCGFILACYNHSYKYDKGCGAKHVGTMEPREHTCVLPINLSTHGHT